ncbi:hypothetical protein DUNSADRAFT_16512 [Dunaliella salina]|uniref:Encoded protein n=1 Tax=Dunaliella salina TaxID=3046 RepID=A0ABQ7G3I7_DUNSA|nr:hypothetical protein DUNSADRAFT_16512 [Dunaliella salina]|eukprot:KAF5829127.1 hypothetical protein DUNSADRAFT_16512 [Dunaliella salina]
MLKKNVKTCSSKIRSMAMNESSPSDHIKVCRPPTLVCQRSDSEEELCMGKCVRFFVLLKRDEVTNGEFSLGLQLHLPCRCSAMPRSLALCNLEWMFLVLGAADMQYKLHIHKESK